MTQSWHSYDLLWSTGWEYFEKNCFGDCLFRQPEFKSSWVKWIVFVGQWCYNYLVCLTWLVSSTYWLNTIEPREIVMPIITLLYMYIMNWQNTSLTGKSSGQCLTYSYYFQRLTLESWYTNLEQTPLNRCQLPQAPYKTTDTRLKTKPTNGHLTVLNNTRTKTRPVWLTIEGSRPTNDWWQT